MRDRDPKVKMSVYDAVNIVKSVTTLLEEKFIGE